MVVDHHRSPRQKRHLRVRSKITGTGVRPRLVVFRSGIHIYAQLIDDTQGKTLVAADDLKSKLKSKDLEANKPPEGLSRRVGQAWQVGYALAERAKKAGLTTVSFDRGGYKYHGRVKALAEGARAGGLTF